MSFIKTIFLTCKSLLTLFHLPLFCRVGKNSFFQKHQISLAICWTRHYFLRLQKSGHENTPDRGRTTLVFIVSKLFVQSRASITMSLLTFTVNGPMVSTSINNVTRDSSFKLVPCCLINVARY